MSTAVLDQPAVAPEPMRELTPEEKVRARAHFAALREADYDKECWLVAVRLPGMTPEAGFKDYVDLLHAIHFIRRADTHDEMWGSEPSGFLVRVGAVLHAAAKGQRDA